MNKEKQQTVTVIGFPIDLGSGRRGVDMGPSALRIAGLESKLEQLGYKVEDTGDINIEIMEKQKVVNPKLKYLDEILKTSKCLPHESKKFWSKINFHFASAVIIQWRLVQLQVFLHTVKKIN